MKRRSSKTNTDSNKTGSEQLPDAKRVRTTRAQELMAAESKKKMAQRTAEGRGVNGVPTFSRSKTTATSSSARTTQTTTAAKPLSPLRKYNLRQGTPPPARYHAGPKSSSLAHTSNLANRIRATLDPGAIEQTVCYVYPIKMLLLVISSLCLKQGFMQSLADQVASMKEMLQKGFANGVPAQQMNSDPDPASQEIAQKCLPSYDNNKQLFHCVFMYSSY